MDLANRTSAFSELMKLAFSTLGCPNWDVRQILETAEQLGYQGVELRAINGSLDLLNQSEFQRELIGTTLAQFEDRDIEVCCVDTSCVFHSRDRWERSEQVDIALAYAELAAALRAPFIRVFPDKIQAGATREETRDYIVQSLSEIARRLLRLLLASQRKRRKAPNHRCPLMGT